LFPPQKLCLLDQGSSTAGHWVDTFVAKKHYKKCSPDWENSIFMTISAHLSVLYKNVAITLAQFPPLAIIA
jgi:hypothetical protein